MDSHSPSSSDSSSSGVAVPSSKVMKGPLGAAEKDPFTSPSAHSVNTEQKLSAKAASFQPVHALSAVPSVAYGSGGASVALGALPGLSTTTLTGGLGNQGGLSSTYRADQITAADDNDLSPINGGRFSTDTQVTRIVKILTLGSDGLSDADFSAVMKVLSSSTSSKGTRIVFPHGAFVYARFTNILDAENADARLQETNKTWRVGYVAPNEFAQIVKPGSPYESAHEGQVLLVARFPHGETYQRTTLEQTMQDLLGLHGQFYAFQRILATEVGTFQIIVEYQDTTMAHRAVAALDGQSIRGIEISVSLHQPDVVSRPLARQHEAVPSTPTRRQGRPRDLADAMAQMNLVSRAPASLVSPEIGGALLSPTGRSFIPNPYAAASPGYAGLTMGMFGQMSNPSMMGGYPTPYTPQNSGFRDRNYGAQSAGYMATPSTMPSFSHNSSPMHHRYTQSTERFRGGRGGHESGRMGMGMGMGMGNRSSYPAAGHHNTVDVNRIKTGADVRTTIMLRNIPNKVNQAQLKEIVDETSFGKYDFMYLRIDFANNCNVGYAFINFEDPWYITEFVEARSGHRWTHYNSDKVAEISYATIQGKDCLVQKFRNSSVMLEHPAFRPKIFYTHPHPLAGEEDVFPRPDNPSKMRRSVENAEHVGLFAPRSGQQFRDEQRRRRSQFDRGTRFAELEEELNFEEDQGYDDAQNHRAEYGGH